MNKRILITAIAGIAICIATNAQTVVSDTLSLSAATAQNPAEVLKGRVSGVRVSLQDGSLNGAINTNIRGFNAIRSDSQPLWIVNGVVLSNGLSQNLNAFWERGGYTTKGDIIPDYSELSYSPALNGVAFLNPYDIERIEVIKDMSTAALYGTQGANGVIIIDTRSSVEDRNLIKWRSNATLDISGRTGSAFRTGFGHNHNLVYSGAVNKTALNLSAYLRAREGVVKRMDNLFGGLHANLETRANPYFWFGLSSIISAGRQSNSSGTAYLGKPSTMILSRYPNRFSGNTLEGWEQDYDDDVEDYRAVTSAWLRVNFTPALFMKASVGADFQSNTRRIWYGEGTYFGASNKGAASIMSSTLFNYNGKVELSYNRYFAKVHHVKALVGGEAIGSRNKFGVMNGTTFDLPYLRARGLATMSSRAAPYKFSREYIIAGVFANLSYDYNGYAGVNGVWRSDFSTKYTLSKPINYPAANAYVDIGKMIFGDSGPISSIRFAGGWGNAGREEYIPYELLGNYLASYPQVDRGTEVFYDGLNRLYSTEWNAGLELSIASRVDLSVKYYDKLTSDSFYIYNFGKQVGSYHDWAHESHVDYTTEGRIHNSGIEADINARILSNGKLAWTVWANAAWNMNRVAAVEYDQMAGRNIGRNISVNILSEGYPVGALFGYQDNPEGGFKDLNGDGEISDADKTVLGNTLPLLSGAIGSSVTYGDFTIDFMLDGAAGHYVANLNKVIAEGRTKLSDRYVEKADFLRLSRLSFEYRVPVSWYRIKALKVQLSATNLFTITGYKGWNPDVNCFGSTVLSNGVDYGSYPAVRTIALGVSATF